MKNYRNIGLLWLYILLILVLPVIGEFIVWRGFLLEAGKVSLSLIFSHIVFIAVMMSIALIVANYNLKEKKIVPKFNVPFASKIANRSVFVLGLAILAVFLLAGLKSLFRDFDSGQIRISLGMLGPVYTWVLLYLTPAILILNSIVFIQSDAAAKRKNKPVLILLFMIATAIGMMTGSKATFIIILIGGIVVLSYARLSLKKIFLLGMAVSAGLVLMTMAIRKIDVPSASYFVIHRATVMSSFGTIAVWNIYPDGIPAETRLYNLLIIGGNNFASSITGYPKNSIEFLKVDLARLITYMSYPDTERAVSGEVNVTITNFGEAILLFGRHFFILYALLAGFIVGFVVRYFIKCVMYGLPLKGSLIGVYLFSVIIPWINSASIWNIIGLPVLIWLFGVYIISYLIVALKPIKLKFRLASVRHAD